MDRDQIGWKKVRRPNIGDRIRFIGRPPGEKWMGNKRGWLRGGDEGAVTRIIQGYPENACPDHDEAPDCVCGGESGRVRPQSASPVVEYELREGGTLARCISPEDEGKWWERVA